jgi:hypothetical protein
MNIFFNKNQPVWQLDERNSTPDDNNRFGERFAAALLIFYTISALLVSVWSAIIIKSGNSENGGPIGLFVQILKTSGII